MNDPSDEQLVETLATRMEERRRLLTQAASLELEAQLLRRKLEAAEAIRDEFLLHFRGESKTPLSQAHEFSRQMLNDPDLTPAQLRELAGRVHREISGLSFQIQNIFAAADLENGSLDPRWTPVDLASLADSVVQDFQHRAAEKDITLDFLEVTPAPNIATTDVRAMVLILSNLLANAIDFSHRPGRIQVRVSTGPEEFLLEVSDEIDETARENLDRISERLIRLGVTGKKNHAGRGLRLSLVKDYVELLGGRIDVRNLNGRGFVRSAFFPAAPIPASPELNCADEAEFPYEITEHF